MPQNLRRTFCGRGVFVCTSMDWTSLVPAAAASLFAYSIAPWRMRGAKWLILWLCAVCGLVMACLRYRTGPETALVGLAFCVGTSFPAIGVSPEKHREPS